MPSDSYIVYCDARDATDLKEVGTPLRSIAFEPSQITQLDEAPRALPQYQILTFTKAPTYEELLQICSRPTAAIVETNYDCDIASTASSLTDVTARYFQIDMSSASAYSLDLASILIRRFECDFEMPDEVKAAIQIALHEFLANSLLHGNLEIGSISNAIDLNIIGEFLDDVESRLADNQLRKRRIKISATWNGRRISVRIEDEGRGFYFNSVIWCRRSSTHSLRGIGIVDSLVNHLEYSKSGRVLRLEFDLASPPSAVYGMAVN